jgi:hypothetical protein
MNADYRLAYRECSHRSVMLRVLWRGNVAHMTDDEDPEEVKRNLLVVLGAWGFLVVAMILGVVIWLIAT